MPMRIGKLSAGAWGLVSLGRWLCSWSACQAARICRLSGRWIREWFSSLRRWAQAGKPVIAQWLRWFLKASLRAAIHLLKELLMEWLQDGLPDLIQELL